MGMLLNVYFCLTQQLMTLFDVETLVRETGVGCKTPSNQTRGVQICIFDKMFECFTERYFTSSGFARGISSPIGKYSHLPITGTGCQNKQFSLVQREVIHSNYQNRASWKTDPGWLTACPCHIQRYVFRLLQQRNNCLRKLKSGRHIVQLIMAGLHIW